MSRYVHFASRLTGWNAIKSRVEQLGLSMTDAQVKLCTAKIKALADVRPIAIDDADSIIRTFHLNLSAENGEEKELLPGLTEGEKREVRRKEREFGEGVAVAGKAEKRELEEVVAEGGGKKVKV